MVSYSMYIGVHIPGLFDHFVHLSVEGILVKNDVAGCKKCQEGQNMRLVCKSPTFRRAAKPPNGK